MKTPPTLHTSLSCYIGADYTDTYPLFEDEQQTIPLDLTNWTALTLTIEAGTPIVLIAGNGLTVDDAAGGVVSAVVHRAMTSTMTPGSVPYTLTGIDPNSNLRFLMDGIFEWVAP